MQSPQLVILDQEIKKAEADIASLTGSLHSLRWCRQLLTAPPAEGTAPEAPKPQEPTEAGEVVDFKA